MKKNKTDVIIKFKHLNPKVREAIGPKKTRVNYGNMFNFAKKHGSIKEKREVRTIGYTATASSLLLKFQILFSVFQPCRFFPK